MLCNNVHSLRDLLYADKNKKGHEQTHAKEYYVATILEEAIKFLTSVIRWEDDFKDSKFVKASRINIRVICSSDRNFFEIKA
jgi:hypothetical protein